MALRPHPRLACRAPSQRLTPRDCRPVTLVRGHGPGSVVGVRDPLDPISDDLVTRVVRERWGLEVGTAEYLPWGFGAWHWAARDLNGRRRWFVTADELDHPTRGDELEATYSAAVTLSESGLGLVVPCVRSLRGQVTHEVFGFAISVTQWVEGAPAEGELVGQAAEETAAMVRALHEGPAPEHALVWDHRLRWAHDLERLGEIVEPEWSIGALAAEAQVALRAHQHQVPQWLQRHTVLAAQAVAARSDWVVTHGEPGVHNQLVTSKGRRLVDWESMRVAPRERDLTDLARSPAPWPRELAEPDPAMLELFDLHWRLNEIGAYAARLCAPHDGSENDRIVLGGLVEQLERPDWFTGC